ncbi:PEP-CTERM sorting domain-containing protein [Halotia branconii]|uniref:PEP-CTERM sorting domain-containing protein n=1 Tax=Halotia branconii CENA392 TaxID=1539056 RepID=A0AAJ6NXP3_9CYAN|nr:PEP-CTERM sorting domain-containing protein [Halotia branconii]WGV28648.1 PEP-CTERM sorting domain-containing protein [Halotia branconii CENA392]
MKKYYKLAISATVICLGLGSVDQAQAVNVTLSTADNQFIEGTHNQGWWSTYNPRLGYNDNFNDNYLTGKLRTTTYRSYFTFDLSTIAKNPVSSATLQIQRFIGSGNSSPTISFFDVSTPASSLNQKINNPDLDIYRDLGSGKNYGTFQVTSTGDSEEILNFTLNSNAIADINAAGGKFFSIGGALKNNVDAGDQYLFGYGYGAPAKLVVNTADVPEPLTIGGTAIAGAMGWWLKRKRKASLTP